MRNSLVRETTKIPQSDRARTVPLSPDVHDLPWKELMRPGGSWLSETHVSAVRKAQLILPILIDFARKVLVAPTMRSGRAELVDDRGLPDTISRESATHL